jgi:hypothetical protein
MGIEWFDYDNHLTWEVEKALANGWGIDSEEANFMSNIIDEYWRRNIRVKKSTLLKLWKEFWYWYEYSRLSKIWPLLEGRIKKRAKVISNTKESTKKTLPVHYEIKKNKSNINSILTLENGLNNKMGSEKEYRQKYSHLTHELEKNIRLPRWILNAIANKETTFWQNLNSWSWSKWMVQLTFRPFEDMKWEAKDWKRYYGKVSKYQKIFQDINLTTIKNIDMWNGVKVWETLSWDIWNKLEKLTDVNTKSREARGIIQDFQDLIKSKKNKHTYFHVLNIIIWAVYYKKLLIASRWNIRKAAVNYNWDSEDGHKYRYWRIVYKNYLKEKDRID